MAETIVLSAAQWIGSLLIQEASALYEVEDQVRSLRKDLEFMQEYLLDADAKKEVKEVHALIGQIRTLAFDAEDAIDTYILQVQLKSTEQTNESWLIRFACFLYNSPEIYKVGKQIQVIQKDLREVIGRFNNYGVMRMTNSGEGARSTHGERNRKKKPLSHPDDDDDYVVGWEKDISKLVEVLMGDGKNQISVLSIVGMGGSGKTTLARKLFSHPYTKECFDCTAWVFISQEWSTTHVLSEILRKVVGPQETTNQYAGVEELVDKLRDVLKKQSYLVVLDDVWRRESLEEILPALPLNNINGGSKIIITTRNREIVQFQNLRRNLYVYEPRPLNEEEGWKLFSNIALNHRSNCNTKSFESLGREMLEKCDGLPLAIIVLAGILSTKYSISEWQQVNEAVSSRVMGGTGRHMYGRVEDLLALSYDDLPNYLKPCFLFLGVFPEDCEIPTGMLMRMWIAEALIVTQDEMSQENVAAQCLEELSHRFMVQVARTNLKGDIKAVRVHDLLRDLCVKKAKEQSFLEIFAHINDPTIIEASASAIQPRRAALHSSTSLPTQASSLRSLVVLTRSSVSHSAYIYKGILDLEVLHHNFKLLRLLTLWGISTVSGTLPAQIGGLIHLRYLEIRATNIIELPASIGNLRNLFTLDYRNVDSDNSVPIKIPNVLWKLVQLRHLFLPIECPWNVDGLKLNTMKNLRSLWGVKQEGRHHWLSLEVPKLSTTLKKLRLVVSTEHELEAAFRCPSLMADALNTFHCELKDGVVARHVEALSDRQHLHKLILIGEVQMKLSLILPTNLIMLKLKDTMLKDVDPMEVLGELAHLKLLGLSNSYLGTSLACKAGSFLQLEELYLDCLKNLVIWSIEKGAMPYLKKLEIVGCKKLQEFPRCLEFVTTLQQLEFFNMPTKFCEQAIECGWSQQRLRLPHNYESIIKHSDSPVDCSSIRKLYEQLTAGLYLNNKKKRYWVIKHNGSYTNCFKVYASELIIQWSRWFDTIETLLRPDECDDGSQECDDGLQECDDGMRVWSKIAESFIFSRDIRFSEECYDGLTEWSEIAESSDSALIKVPKLKEVNVVKLLGSFNTADLSPQVLYEVAFEIMLQGPGSTDDWDMYPFLCGLTLPNSETRKRGEKLNDKPKEEWIQVLAGEFETTNENIGQIQFSLFCGWPELVIRGVVIQPKR